jgi:hypothetical protein
LKPWTKNPKWAQQALEERLAEEAMRRKKQEESSGGDIVARLVMILAGAVFVSMLFGNPPPTP